MAVSRKGLERLVAHIETKGCARLSPPYAESVEHLPSSFWTRFEESLAAPTGGALLEASDWSLVQAAHDLAYHSGRQLLPAADWSRVTVLGSDGASASDVLRGAFGALSGIDPDDCEIVELVPFERLVLRVHGYWGLLVPGPDRNRRTAALVVRGLCAGMMDLAYGGDYDEAARPGSVVFTCSQSRSVARGDPFDEFVASRIR